MLRLLAPRIPMEVAQLMTGRPFASESGRTQLAQLTAYGPGGETWSVKPAAMELRYADVVNFETECPNVRFR